MRILKPANEYGQDLISTGHVVQGTFFITKPVTARTVLITPDDIAGIDGLHVTHIYDIDNNDEELLLPSKHTDDGLVIVVQPGEGEYTLDIKNIKVYLELTEQNAITTGIVTPSDKTYYSSGIFVGTEKMMGHLDNSDIHMTYEMKAEFEMLFEKYKAAQAETEPPPVAPQAMSEAQVMAHFSKHAMAGTPLPPSRYYTRWVPNALKGDLASEIVGDNTMGYFPTRAEVPATDTVAGETQWWGKEWVGYWEYCNFIEAQGCKFPTAIKGDANFSWNENVGVIMPALFFNTCEEVVNGETTTRYGYTIADSPWEELNQSDRDTLMAHGITTLYRHPCATYFDPNKYGTNLGGYVPRCYMVFGAFAGGYEGGKMVSKRNKPQFNNMCYNVFLQNISTKGSGDGMRDGVAHIWEVVKYGTKHSQKTFGGLSNYSPGNTSIAYTTVGADYIVPLTSTSNFSRMCSAYLNIGTSVQSSYPYTMTNKLMEARVKSIESRTFKAKNTDGTVSDVTCQCLVFDPETIQPFYCCKTTDEANALQAEGYLAFSHVNGSGLPLTGETSYVLDHCDGACYSCTATSHPYRVQGLELLAGAWRLRANTAFITGITEFTRPVITINTVYNSLTGLPIADNMDVYNPDNPSSSTLTKETITGFGTSHQWCFCYQRHQTRSNNGSVIKANAYCAGCHDGLNGSNIALQVEIEPVTGAVMYTKMGTGSTSGHQDYRWYSSTAVVAGALSGSSWRDGTGCGSVALTAGNGLGNNVTHYSAGL